MNVLREIRIKLRLTQDQIATKLNTARLCLGTITGDLVSKWELGAHYPGLAVRQWYAGQGVMDLKSINTRLLAELQTPKQKNTQPEGQLQMDFGGEV